MNAIARGLSSSLVQADAVPASRAPAQKHVVRGIGDTEELARTFARSLREPALGVDALDGCSSGKDAVVAMLDHFEFEPRNIA